VLALTSVGSGRVHRPEREGRRWAVALNGVLGPMAGQEPSTTGQREPPVADRAGSSLRVMTSESPRKCSRTYAATADQVRHARAFLRRALDGCPATDDAVLLISELCANAVQHSSSSDPGGTFTVHVEVHEGEHVCVEVRDRGGLWVAKGPRDDGRGHGLNILREIASDWGREGDPEAGWTIWFRLDWP
jgi:anti-sigma regulatory factor (Ser/Thr protein kinase)